jgi:hypothetical protein
MALHRSEDVRSYIWVSAMRILRTYSPCIEFWIRITRLLQRISGYCEVPSSGIFYRLFLWRSTCISEEHLHPEVRGVSQRRNQLKVDIFGCFWTPNMKSSCSSEMSVSSRRTAWRYISATAVRTSDPASGNNFTKYLFHTSTSPYLFISCCLINYSDCL